MLSTDLLTLAEGLRQIGSHGRDLTDSARDTLDAAAELLVGYASDAKALEQQIIPMRARLAPNQLPPNVFSIDDLRIRRAVRDLTSLPCDSEPAP